jgi:hypothetical protein
MAFDYTAMRLETVDPLINEFGKDGQLAVNVPATGAPYDSQLDSETLYPVRLVQTKFKKADNNGTLVVEGDVLYLVSTQGVTIDPDLADRMTVGGVTYQVVRIDPLVPGPVIMFWYIHARK